MGKEGEKGTYGVCVLPSPLVTAKGVGRPRVNGDGWRTMLILCLRTLTFDVKEKGSCEAKGSELRLEKERTKRNQHTV